MRRGALPPALERALESPGGKCYRHCDRPLKILRPRSALPGSWQVFACPAGVVSVTRYAEWTRRDPSPAARRVLRAWTVPSTMVRDRDLRLATRHGPELGPAAERILARERPSRGIRVVYWRVYPFRARDGTERRLVVCVRRSHPSPVFFAASPASAERACPVCTRKRRRPRSGAR